MKPGFLFDLPLGLQADLSSAIGRFDVDRTNESLERSNWLRNTEIKRQRHLAFCFALTKVR